MLCEVDRVLRGAENCGNSLEVSCELRKIIKKQTRTIIYSFLFVEKTVLEPTIRTT